jgi:16S rRNA G966 N2-methylase RsmD
VKLERGKTGPKNELLDTLSNNSEYKEILDENGIGYKAASRWQQVAEMPEDEFEEHLEEMRGEKPISTSAMIKELKVQAKTAKRIELAELGKKSQPSDMAKVLTGDFREIMDGLRDETIDMIFCDPPYDEGAIPLYGELALLAKQKLKIGGSILVYAGHYALPEIFPLMTPHLRYWWTISLNYATGPYPRLMGKNVFVQWKPMLWFVKEKRTNTEFVADSINVPAPDKIAQDWQQGEVDYYINKICPLDGVVLDPMCGSGTTLIASAKVGRRSIGIEIDPERANVARGRIEKELKNEKVLF